MALKLFTIDRVVFDHLKPTPPTTVTEAQRLIRQLCQSVEDKLETPPELYFGILSMADIAEEINDNRCENFKHDLVFVVEDDTDELP